MKEFTKKSVIKLWQNFYVRILAFVVFPIFVMGRFGNKKKVKKREKRCRK